MQKLHEQRVKDAELAGFDDPDLEKPVVVLKHPSQARTYDKAKLTQKQFNGVG